jgi:hypothetical protein
MCGCAVLECGSCVVGMRPGRGQSEGHYEPFQLTELCFKCGFVCVRRIATELVVS